MGTIFVTNEKENILLEQFDLFSEVTKFVKIERESVLESGKVLEFNHPTVNHKCKLELEKDLVIVEENRLECLITKCENTSWEYNGAKYYDVD